MKNTSCILSRTKWTKKVDAFKSITFTLLKETDLFFASIKNQKWTQDELDPNDVVKNRYLSQQSVYIPRASLHIALDRARNMYEMHFTEDVVNK